MKAAVEKAWQGEPKLVIGIDVGTTQSAVAYAYLYPQGPQYPQRVTRWPGQEAQKSETKIPSIIWYDGSGKARAFGAEARTSAVEDEAAEQEWELVQFFKLHLHPETMRAHNSIQVPPLPAGITLEQIYKDFLGYLFRHTEEFFKEKQIDGAALWLRLRGTIEFVIAHPNGWDTYEQGILRQAATEAGLVDSLSQAEERIQFVSEAEASVHFVMYHADVDGNFQPGTEFLVCDAGGSTVDTTLYVVDAIDPRLLLKERKTSACIQAGAIFVDQSAQTHFRKIFSEAGFESDELDEYVSEAVTSFENDTKKAFKDPLEEKQIKVGTHRFNNVALGIKRGKMSIPGTVIESFFKSCTSEIVKSVRNQIKSHLPKYLLIVGGFGESPYLRSRLQQELGTVNLQIVLANDSTAKAVSDGAIIWFLKQSVIARATRFEFGIEIKNPATADLARVLGRKLMESKNGDYIHGYWSAIVSKGEVIGAAEERSQPYVREFEQDTIPQLSRFSTVLYASDHNGSPKWFKDPDGNVYDGFREICTIKADLSNLGKLLKRKQTIRGIYWEVEFKIVIKFGLTSLKAYLSWNEKGIEKRSPAALIPSSFC